MTLLVKLSNGLAPAKLVKENPKTVWVRLLNGKVIKRSKEKHLVTPI